MSASAPPPPPTDVLDSSGGAPLPGEPARRRSTLRRGLLAGGALVGLAVVGVGAWAAYSFFQTGPQPSQALPADTLGYVSVDLDPSGGQKIEALKTLNKFPKFKDSLNLGTGDDLRKKLWDEVQDSGDCTNVDYGDDIEPWLGDRAAVAAVVVDDKPQPVVVLQVTDADKADAGLAKVKGCSADDKLGWHIDGGWAVLAETDAIADSVAADAAKGSLADDSEFKHWTDEAGDPGVVTMYAGPQAGDYLADHAEDLLGFPLGMLDGGAACDFADSSGDSSSSELDDVCGNTGPTTSGLSKELSARLRDFKGIAATVRFSHGAIELAVAGDSKAANAEVPFSGGGAAAETVESLPADTGAAFGVGFKDGWFSDLVDQVASFSGQDPAQLLSDLSEQTGLTLPADAETLAGDSAALAVGPGVDPETMFDGGDGGDGSDVPIALKIKGDPDAISRIVDKIKAQAGSDADFFGTDTAGDSIAIGPDADYRADVVKPGKLGDNAVFKDVVRESDRASTIFFVNLDEFDGVLKQLAGDDAEAAANLEPISGFGVSAWVDGDTSHAVVRLTTD